MKLKHISYLIILGLFFACTPEFEDYDYSSGSADFSNYVALGNSLTAGYADGALYLEGQQNSFPSMIANQLENLGIGAFEQPLLNGEYGILPGKRKLDYADDCLGVTSLSPVPDVGTLEDIIPVGKTVQNMGIPGAKSFHLIAPNYGDFAGIQAGTANPYYARFASSAVSTVLGDAAAQLPTFYTLWIGNNDVLGYASNGGASDAITDQQTFAFAMNTILETLNGTGANGAIANIPGITSAPYFTFMGSQLPYNGLVLERQGQADSLHAGYLALGLDIPFSVGPNPFIVQDATTGFPRQAEATDIFLLTLPTDSIKCFGYGSAFPIPHKYILDEDETAAVNAAIDGYNQTIEGLAAQWGVALVDMNAYMVELQQGLTFDGVTLSDGFITGNAFSLDGVHLTPMGYAVVANKFITTINEYYGSTIPTVSVNDYRANVIP